MSLNVSGLTKRYDRVVIDQFTYQFESGRLYVIKGVSGCGKTTLLNILGGLDSAYEGEVSFDGRTGRNHLSASVGYIFQQSLLISDLTVRNNLLLVNPDSAKIDAVMARLGVSHLYDKYPTELSGGERQRIAVVRALITGAKVLLADEPTASLDETNSVGIATLLSELCKDGCTVIVATHEHYFDELADEIIYLDYGKIGCVEIRTERTAGASATSPEAVEFAAGREVEVPVAGREAGATDKVQKVSTAKSAKKAKKKNEEIIEKTAEKPAKGENLSLLKILFTRGKRQWKISSFVPTIILTLLILVVSTVTNRVDAILLGYLEHYYPSDIVELNAKKIGEMDQELLDAMTVYYPYMAEEDDVRALYYAEKEDSVLGVKGMLKYGYFPETEEQIIVSYDFAQEKFGPVSSAEDIVGKTYTFAGREFTITGCLHSFDEDKALGFFFNTESLFDSDWLYYRYRGSMIFMDYDVIKEIGEVSYNPMGSTSGSVTATCDGWMRDPALKEKIFSLYASDYRRSTNSIVDIIDNTTYAIDPFMLILYFVLIVCFLIACIFVRSKVDIELHYRSREIGFLQIFKVKKRTLRRMILWEYLMQLAISMIIPLSIYVVLMVSASAFLNAFMIFNVVHVGVAFGTLLVLYIHALTGTIKRYMKRDVIELIRA